MDELNNDSLLATSLCEEIEIVNPEEVISCADASTQTNNIPLVDTGSQCDENGTEVLQ